MNRGHKFLHPITLSPTHAGELSRALQAATFLADGLSILQGNREAEKVATLCSKAARLLLQLESLTATKRCGLAVSQEDIRLKTRMGKFE